VRPLHHLRALILHVVAQIVEAQLVVGGVGHVAIVGGAALVVVETVGDDAGRQPEEAVDAAHPLRVAAGEIVVHRDHMHAVAGERVEIDRGGCHQRLAFAGAHLGDTTVMQHHAADQLHVEMAHAEHAPRRFPHRGESGHQKIVQRLAGGELGAELDRPGAQLLVAEGGHFRLQGIDGLNGGAIAFDPAVVRRTEELPGKSAKHGKCLYRSGRGIGEDGSDRRILRSKGILHRRAQCGVSKSGSRPGRVSPPEGRATCDDGA